MGSWAITNDGSETFRTTDNNNFLIGQTTDDGINKLQVTGTAKLIDPADSHYTFETSGTVGFKITDSVNGRDLYLDNNGSLTGYAFIGQNVRTNGYSFNNSFGYKGGINMDSNMNMNFLLPDSGSVQNNILCLKGDTQNILIGSTVDDGINKLQVTGDSRFTGKSIYTKSVDNSTNNGIKLDSSADTGVYAGADGRIYLQYAGSIVFQIVSTTSSCYSDFNVFGELRGKSAVDTAYPTITFINDPDTGLCNPSANNLVITNNSIETARFTENNNVLIGSAVDDGINKLQVNGYTKLGEDATGIKMKVLTGMTASTEGGSNSIAHGLNLSNVSIVSATCMVRHSSQGGIFPDSTDIDGIGYEYSFVLDSGGANFIVFNHDTNSENILSKPIVITIWYTA